MNPGTNLDGYRVLALVGRGGNAEVYRVHHIDLNVDRALKVPLHVDAAGRERLVREAQIQSRLRHTNLVTVFDLVAVDGVPALVMDYVGGGTLADLIARRKIPLEEVDSIFRQICSGVAVAHAAGLVH